MIGLRLKKRTQDRFVELVLRKRIFSKSYYEHHRGLSFETVEAAVKDYLTFGEEMGFAPHLYFSPQHYAAQLSSKPSMGLLVDYLTRGGVAGLDPSLLFQSRYYLSQNEDVKQTGVNPLAHYLEFGYFECRRPNALFDPDWYNSKNPDLDPRIEDLYSHYLRFGAREGRLPNAGFDRTWYLSTYPQAAAFGHEALIHYLRVGEAAGLKPNPYFDPVAYAQKHGAEVTDGALNHYLFKNGDKSTERVGEFDPREYVSRHPDAEDDPLFHCLQNRKVGAIHVSVEPARVAATPSARRLHLDEAYSLSSADFDAFRQARVRSCAGSASEAQIGVIVVADGDESDLSRTLSALDAVRDKDADVIVVHRSEGLRKAHAEWFSEHQSVAGSETKKFIILRAGDIPDRNFWPAARAGLGLGADITVFDTFFRQDGRCFPVLLPGFNPLFLTQVGWDCARWVLSGWLLAAWLRSANQSAFDGAALVAFATRASGEMPSPATRHVAWPLVEIHDVRPSLDEARRKSLRSWYGKDDSCPGQKPTCSLVIATKGNPGLVKQLIDSVLRTGAQRIANIIVVPSTAEHQNNFASLEKLLGQRSTSIVWYDKPFNFSDKCNVGAAQAFGEILIFLNDDLVPVGDYWLDHLLAPFSSPRVGITGAQLLYPNGTSQHSGMFVTREGVTGHTLRSANMLFGDYLAMGSLYRNMSATTGATLAIRRSLFEDLNGFDSSLANYIQDVDLCLRARENGWHIVFCPHALLIHLETITLGIDMHHPSVLEARGREFQYFMRRWEKILSRGDPYHNMCFDPLDQSLRTILLD